MPVQGKYTGVDLPTLQIIKQSILDAMKAARDAGQAYGIGGRNLSRVSYDAMANDLNEVLYAIARASGTKIDRTQGRFQRPSS